MLDYNANFLAELNKGKSDPAVRIHLQEDIFFAEKTSEFDWGSNSAESSVDYASLSGSVILENETTLWVCDSNNDKIYNIQTNGTLISSFATSVFDVSATGIGGISFQPITLPPEGTLWVCDRTTEKVYNIQTDGTHVSEFFKDAFDTLATSMTGVTYTLDDTLWICDSITRKFYNVQKDGTLISSFFKDAFDVNAFGPQGITEHSNGTLWICDSVTDKIYNVQTDGTLISSFSTSVYDVLALAPTGISFSSDGTLWVCDDVTNKIYNIQTNGTLISSFATSVFDVSATALRGISQSFSYKTMGNILTDAIDLGSTPTVDGEWEFADSVPAGTTLTYEAWSSATGVFDIWHEYFPSGRPSPRNRFAYCIDGSDFYLFGGHDGTTHLNDLWKCDLSDSSFPWTELTSGATARQDSTLVVYNGKLYLFGGRDASSYFNDIYEYTISGDSWALKSPSGTLPSIRRNHIAVIYNGKMYIHGGYRTVIGHLKDIHEYDISGNSWTSKTSGATERYGHVAVVSGAKMYVYAGWNTGLGAINSIEEYDFTGDSWATKTAGGTAANLRVAIIHNGKIYVHGGNTGGGQINSTFEYDISGDSWTTVTAGSTARAGHGGVLYGDKLFIFGGDDGSNELDDMWSYGTLGGDAVSIGTVQDGDAITDLKRYYAVRANLGANTNRDETPVLSSIIADFANYLKIRSSIGISALTTTIDLFEESTISQMTVTLALNTVTSSWMATKKPRNKRVRIFIGFNAPGFAADDFEKFYFGTVANADITSADKVKIYIDGLAKDWKEDVPETWETAGDDVTWTNEHPIDVMLDIYNTYLPVRASALLLSSFLDVKAATPGWVVTRTITDNPIEGKKLLEQLRKLMSCFFIPQPDGSVKIKRWDPSEAAVNSFTDLKLMGKNYIGNYRKIINRIFIYYDWAGTGDDTGDFDAVIPGTRPLSKADYGKWETETIKDKWTPVAASSQVQDRITKLLDRYEDPPPRMPATVDLKEMATEEGDIVNITTKRAPSTNMLGILDVRFQVVKKTIDWQGKKLNLELLAVTG